MDFVYLNNKSGYSFLKSSIKVNDLVRYAKDKGMPSLALTDINNMVGVLEFVKECSKNNIKPIIGMEVLLENYEIPLILLSTCNEGYISLCKLTKYVSKNTFNDFVSLDELSKCNEGLICILPFIRGHMYEYNHAKKMELYLSLKTIFKNLYIGLEYYSSIDINKLNDAREFAFSNNINTVPVIDVICENASNVELNDVLRAKYCSTTIDKLDTINYEGHYFINESKLRSIFSEEELKSTLKISNICDTDISKIKGDLVKYPLKEGVSDYEYLCNLAHKGLSKRLNNHVTQRYIERLNYELNIIKKMNFVNYFLVVFDYVRFAKTHDILVGPGRGSGGGCLVAYSLGITSTDPIKYDLLFERFLNPERVSMPDLDIDFINTKRDKIFEYLIQKYGNERTCRILAVSSFTATECFRTVAKAYGVSDVEANEISKKYFNTFNTKEMKLTLTNLYNNSPSFKSFINTDPKFAKIYNIALRLEDLPSHVTVHAAGIVICDSEVCEIMPVYKNNEGLNFTQYDGHSLDNFNIYKMDILSITNLAILDDCAKKVYEETNNIINIYNIDVEDPNIYQVFKDRRYAGIFQFDGVGIKSASNSVCPSNISEIASVLALGRPGPNQYISTFANRKKGLEKVVYPHPSLEPILKETYGIIVYQEQIMQILTKMAGFSLGRADLIRRTISNKNKEEIQKYRNEFIDGCVKNNYSINDANKVYDDIVKFADYGFNKSHSVEYSMVALQLAYFKTYYPSIFYASIINILDKTKLQDYYYEMKSNNINLLNPSINKSYYEARKEKDNVRLGFQFIGKLSGSLIKIIIEERQNGLFSSFTDFVKRTFFKGINKETLFALIEAGCFDEFNISRSSLKYNIDTVILYVNIASKEVNGVIVIDNSTKEPIIREVKDDKQLVSKEELLRLGISLYNPLKEYRNLFTQNNFKTINQLKNNTTVLIIGKIVQLSTIKTKNNDSMAIINVEDETGIIKVVVFPEKYNLYQSLLNLDEYIQIKGNVEYDNKKDSNDSKLEIIVTAMKKYKFPED